MGTWASSGDAVLLSPDILRAYIQFLIQTSLDDMFRSAICDATSGWPPASFPETFRFSDLL